MTAIQLDLWPFMYGLLFGNILAGICMIVFLIFWIASKHISGIPCAYTIGSFIVSSLTSIWVTSTHPPPHFWIGLIGGWLLLVLAFIQAFLDISRRSNE